MASLQVAQPGDVFEEAMRLRRGAGGYRKRPRSALPMLQELAAAMGSAGVPIDNSTAATRELGHMHLRGEGMSPDVGAAVRHYERAAEEGDPESQSMLGVLHSAGFGVARDVPLAATLLHFAAEGGDIHAQLALGYRHLLGVSAPKACQKSLMYYKPVAEKVVANAQRYQSGGTIEKVRLTVDNPKGVAKRGADDDVLQYYEHSALKGSVDAQLTLGHLHFHGARGLPADVDKAFAYYSKAAAAGESTAYAQLGHMYAQGLGTPQSNETALEYFRKGAAKEHPASQNGLGYMFMHGYGVERNYKKAAEFFKAAAERGNADSQFNLGALYIGGMGLKKAYDKALHYFTLSAHQGHTLALYNLAQMHLNGLGTPRSCPTGAQFLKAVAERGPWGAALEEAQVAVQEGPDAAVALQLYAVLAEGGFELAQANVAFLLDQHYVHSPRAPLLGIAGEEIAVRALHMYRLAAQQGNVEAELKLGDYHYYGYGTPVDLEAAVSHYRAASEQRSAQAMFNLAYMYAHGLGLTRDYHLAKRHYDMALETATEAWGPVQLALLELKMLQWWQDSAGSTTADPYEYLRQWMPPLASELPAAASSLESDSALILALCGLLGVVLVMRQRQQLPTT